MLEKVSVDGVKIPDLYIARNKADVDLAIENGIPFIKWHDTKETLLKILLRPVLEEMFPAINWNKVLGRRSKRRLTVIVPSDGGVLSQFDDDDGNFEYDNDEVLRLQYEHDKKMEGKREFTDSEFMVGNADVADKDRYFNGGNQHDSFTTELIPVHEWITDENSSVDIKALQNLGMLPKFVGDIADCIRSNIGNRLYWTEGFNKKHGVPIGNFNGRPELPNLIILDISHSIPEGIAATMLTLIDTLREQCNAELIITSAKSGYYPRGVELPSPQTMREYYGRSNESRDFKAILDKHIAGREFGHVISFGDYDSPDRIGYGARNFNVNRLANTRIHAVHHYHTWDHGGKTGYAKWVHEVSPDVEAHYDNQWCEMIRK